MSEEIEILKLVARSLDEAGVIYMISGSMAANRYTVPRMTRDIDIVIELSQTDIDRFIKLFQNDFYLDSDVIKRESARRGMFNLIHKKYLIKVDFILSQPSRFQQMTFARRRQGTADNQRMWFISPEDLILAKLLWAKDSQSEMQLNDVRNLLRTNQLDKAHLQEWVSTLGLGAAAQKAGL